MTKERETLYQVNRLETLFFRVFLLFITIFVFFQKKYIKNEHNSLKQEMRHFQTKWKWAMECWKMDSNFRIKLRIALFLYIKRVCTVSKGYEDLKKTIEWNIYVYTIYWKKKKKDWKKVFIIFLDYFKIFYKVTPVLKKSFKICISL